MTLKNFKRGIVNKFDKTVKDLTNRAIPIAKKEAARVMKSTSSKAMEKTFDLLYVAAVGIALTSVYLKPSDVGPVATALEGIRTVNINIENLTINT